MGKLKCECGSEFFFQQAPQTFDERIRSWNAGDKIDNLSTTITILKCLVCNKITLPSTSFLGKNILDPEVQDYKKLLDDVTSYNNRVERINNLYKSVDNFARHCDFKMIETENTFKALLDDIKFSMTSPNPIELVELIEPENIEEVKDKPKKIYKKKS